MTFDFQRATPYKWGDVYVQEGFFGWQVASSWKTKASPATPRSLTWYFDYTYQALVCGTDYDTALPDEL